MSHINPFTGEVVHHEPFTYRQKCATEHFRKNCSGRVIYENLQKRNAIVIREVLTINYIPMSRRRGV